MTPGRYASMSGIPAFAAMTSAGTMTAGDAASKTATVTGSVTSPMTSMNDKWPKYPEDMLLAKVIDMMADSLRISESKETLYGPHCDCCMRRGMVRLPETEGLYQCPRTGQVHKLRVGAHCGVWMQPLDAYNKEMCA